MKKVMMPPIALNGGQAAIAALLGFIVWLLLVSGLHLLPAHAGPGPRAMAPEKRLAHLKDRLQLSDRQVEQVRPILEDMAARRRDIMDQARSQGGSGRASFREDMRVLREETDARLSEILSTEQMDAWKSLREEQRGRFHQRRRPDS